MEVSTALIPKELREKVEAIGAPVTSADLDVYRTLREAEDKRIKLQTVLAAWEGQNREERAMRRQYAG